MSRALLALTFAVTACAPSAVPEHAEGPEAFEGTYLYDEVRHAGVARQLERVFAPELERLDPFLRGIMRARLQDPSILDLAPDVPARIRIDLDGETVRVELVDRGGDEESYVSTLGEPVRHGREVLTQRFRGGDLEQVFRRPDGTRRYHVLSLEERGQRLAVRLVVPRGDRVLDVTLPFRRAPTGT